MSAFAKVVKKPRRSATYVEYGGVFPQEIEERLRRLVRHKPFEQFCRRISLFPVIFAGVSTFLSCGRRLARHSPFPEPNRVLTSSVLVRTPPMSGKANEEIRAFFQLLWPVSLTSLIEFVPALVSIAFVGVYCDRNALDGSALGTMYFNVAALSIGVGLLTALDTLAPQAVGAGEDKLLGVYIQRGGLVLAVVLVPLCAAAVFAADILIAIGQPPEVARRAGQFVRWNLFSLPCYWAFELVRKAFHACSVVRPLVVIGCASTLVHCILCYIFVATDWFFGIRFGFVGAALARSVSMAVAILSLCAYSSLSGFSKRWWSGVAPWHVVTKDIGLFLRLGGAGCAAVCFEWWSFEFLALMAGWLSRPEVMIGTHAILFNLAAFFYMGLTGGASAAGIRTGLALGNGDPNGAKLAVRVALSFSCAIGLFNALCIYVGRHELPKIFANDPAIRHAATLALPALAIYQVFDAFNAVSGGAMRGAGRQEAPAVIMGIAYYVFGLPCAVVLSFVYDFKVLGLWLGLTAGLFVATILLSVSLLRLDWKLLAHEAVATARAALPDAEESGAGGEEGCPTPRFTNSSAPGLSLAERLDDEDDLHEALLTP